VSTTFVASGANSTFSHPNLSLTVPSQAQAGDLLLAVMVARSSNSLYGWGVPSGWSAPQIYEHTNPSPKLWSIHSQKIALSGDASSTMVFTVPATVTTLVGRIYVFRTVSQTAPIPWTGLQWNNMTTTHEAPSLQDPVPGMDVVIFPTAVNISQGVTVPSGFTGATETGTLINAADTACSYRFGYRSYTSSNATGTVTSSSNGTINSMGLRILIRRFVPTPGIRVFDGGTWRTATQKVSVYDGSTWRDAQGLWVFDGTTWRQQA
jgi:hypothetical protein